MLSGNNGILQRATDAKTKTDIEQIKERIKLAYHAALTGGQGSYTKESLENELENEFGDDFEEVDDSDNTNWVLKAKGQSVTIPAGKKDNLQILKSFFIGKNRWSEVWNCKSNGICRPEQAKVNGKDVFVVGVEEEKDYILYDEKIFEVFYDGDEVWDNVTNIILSDVKTNELGWHNEIFKTADGTYDSENVGYGCFYDLVVVSYNSEGKAYCFEDFSWYT